MFMVATTILHRMSDADFFMALGTLLSPATLGQHGSFQPVLLQVML